MLHLRKLCFAFLVAIIVLALAPTAGWSQNVYGTVAGAVTDTSGAAVANATVTLTNLDTAQKRSIETDASGNYTFVNILPGRYKLEGEKTGFKKFVREPIVVQIESGLRVDISLQVGAQTETVEVTAEAPFAPAANELAGASGGSANGDRVAAERPQSAGIGRFGAGRCATGHPVGWQFFGGQSRWR